MAQPPPGITEQWVSKVLGCSSQYDQGGWSAQTVIGSPKVYPNYGDKRGTWAQGTKDAKQYIEVEFPEKVFITKIDIYETYHAGAVKRILAKQQNGNWYTVWETSSVTNINSSRIFSPNFPSLTFESNVLRIQVDCTASKSWCEIDAVKLYGSRGAASVTQQLTPVNNSTEHRVSRVINNPNNVEQWVSKVINFSSQYNTTSWAASSAEGAPKVYPKYGDIPGAWAMKNIDANQFLELEFAEKIFIEKIDIYETYHAGGVKRIRAKRPDGSWFTVWETPKVFCQKSSRIFSPQFQKLPFHCNILRVDVDCTGCNTWVEIDAVKVIGTKFNFNLPPANTDITLDLVQLVNNPLFSDITFDVGGAVFYGHKAILSVRSDYFNAMFNFDSASRPQVPTAPYPQPSAPPQGAIGGPQYPPESHLYPHPPSYDAVMSGNPILPSNVPPQAVYQPASQTAVPLKDVDPRTFGVVLHYVYTNKLAPNCQSQLLPTVWRTADRFALEGLKSLTIMEISNKLTIDNVVDVYVDVISALPVIDIMRECCELYMQSNFGQVVRHKKFIDLPKELVLEITQKLMGKK